MTFSRNLIEDIGSLYSSIASQDSEILNEESEYYNEDFAYIFEDVCETICISLLSRGYSAEAVLDYIDYASEDELTECYINSDITSLSENLISEEYFSEQLELLSEALPLVAGLAAGAKLAGKVLLGKGARAAVAKGAGAVGKGLSVAAKRALGPGGRKLVGGAVSKLKGLAGAAKGALSKLPGPIKTAGKWALGGAAFEAGSRGVKKLMGDEGSTPKPSPDSDKSKWNASKELGGQAAFKAGGGAAKMKQNPGMSAADIQKQGMINIRNKPQPAPSAPSGGGSGGGGKPPAPPKPSASEKPKPEGSKLTPMQQWAKANPKLADKVKVGQSGYDEISAKREKPGPNEKQDQTPTQGPADAKIDTDSVEKDLKAAQEKAKRSVADQRQGIKASYEYDAYDLVLEYLLSQGHADTLEEANYVMMEMDAEMVQDIVEQQTGAIRADVPRPGQRTVSMTATGKEPIGDKLVRQAGQAISGFLGGRGKVQSTTVQPRKPLVSTPKPGTSK
jgi:hypothetical protein